MNILFFIRDIAEQERHFYTDDLLMAEHVLRGDRVWAARPRDLVENIDLQVVVSEYLPFPQHIVWTQAELILLNSFDFIYYRAMPPIQGDALLATYFLERCSVPFCNAPSAIRAFNEKLLAFHHFREFMPPTIVASNPQVIAAWGKDYGYPLLLKPLDQYQAKGIIKVNQESDIPISTHQTMVQRYLPFVETQGSKRIFLLDTEILGAFNCYPIVGDFKTNDHMDVPPQLASLTSREKKICKSISQFLVQNGIRFSALDLIDEQLLEVNITCPGGLWEYNKVHSGALESIIVNQLVSLFS